MTAAVATNALPGSAFIGMPGDASTDASQQTAQQLAELITQALVPIMQQMLQQLQQSGNQSPTGEATTPAPASMPAPATAAPPAMPAMPAGGYAPAGGTPAAAAQPGGATPAPATGGAGGAGGATGAGGGTDLENAMSATQQKDPTLFAKTLKDGQSGDGNALAEDELQAYKEGDITKDQAIDEIKGAQSLANQNGGGKINGHVKNDAKELLGGSYIKGGQTRAGHAISKALESFTGIGAIVKGIKDKNSKKSETILDAAQPALQQAGGKAMQDMQEADPELAQKYQQDAKSGDGNAMVKDMIQLKGEEQSGQVPDTFTDQDAQLLGSQVGYSGKGKVNGQLAQQFSQTFGADTLFRGSSRGAKAFNKLEDGVGNFMQKIVSPVTDGVTGVNDLVHGNVKGAFSEFGKAAVGAATDLTMVVAPEAAPEIAAGEMAARGAEGAAEAASAGGSTMNNILKGAKVLDKGNEYYEHANDAANYLNGNSSENNGYGETQAG